MKFSQHILIIDDNPLAIKLITNYLNELEYTCVTAKNGKEAFDLLSNYAFSLVICDLNMPIMNGYEFITTFRKQHEYDLIPIIVVSSDDKEENIIKILNSGADDFISKPLHEQVFISKIKAIIQKNELKKNEISNLSSKLFDYSGSHILFCTEGGNSAFANKIFEDSGFSYTIITETKELFELLYFQEVALICIDQSATWLFDVYQRFTKTVQQTIPIVCFLSEGLELPIDEIHVSVLYKSFSKSYIINQLRYLCLLQQKNKSEYITSLKRALLRSSFLFERFKEEDYYSFKVSILHENYEDVPGGDFYEFFNLHDRYKLIFMGDIMGKSWSAWMYVPIYLAYIRSTIKFISSRNINKIIHKPEKILRMLNQYCAKDLQLSEVFTTLSLVVLDSFENKVFITSAGGISPLYYNSETKKVSEISLSGNILGIDSFSEFISVEISCNPQDVLLFYSDGFSEAMQLSDSEIVGKEKMKRIFESYISKKLTSSLDFETEYLNQCDIQKFNDDRSLLVVSRL